MTPLQLTLREPIRLGDVQSSGMSDINRRRHRSNRVCSFILFYFSSKPRANFLRWILCKIIKLNALYLIVIESGEDQCIKFVLLR